MKKIVSMHYSYDNCSIGGSYSIEMVRKNEKPFLCYVALGKQEYKPAAVDEEVLDKLEEIAKRHNIADWNGYHKSDPDVLDGEGFSVRICFADETVYFSGSNCAPKGYWKFYDEAKELLLPFVKEAKKHKRNVIARLFHKH